MHISCGLFVHRDIYNISLYTNNDIYNISLYANNLYVGCLYTEIYI